MEHQFEYVDTTHCRALSLNSVAMLRPCSAELGKFALWFMDNDGLNKDNREILNLLVEDKKWIWLDWLAEHEFCVKRRKKAVFTPDNVRVEICSEGQMARVWVEDKVVASLDVRKGIYLPDYAQQDFLPTDSEGRVRLFWK